MCFTVVVTATILQYPTYIGVGRQSGGRCTATLYTSALKVSSFDSVIL